MHISCCTLVGYFIKCLKFWIIYLYPQGNKKQMTNSMFAKTNVLSKLYHNENSKTAGLQYKQCRSK